MAKSKMFGDIGELIGGPMAMSTPPKKEKKPKVTKVKIPKAPAKKMALPKLKHGK